MTKTKSVTGIGSINTFYTELASIYSAISNDRDFYAQCQLMKSNLDSRESGIKYLELCAGPAEHGLAFSETDEIWAVDASEEMKHEAIKMGFKAPSQYIVTALPNLDHLEEAKMQYFDLISLLRYSIGYIEKHDTRTLFQKVFGLLRPGGCCFLELHNFKDLIKNLDNLDIKERHFKTDDGGDISCIWPSGDIEWDEHDLVVKMNVNIKVQCSPTKAPKSYTLSSIENIYLPKEIERFTQGLFEYNLLETRGTAFHGSKLILLRKP